jgi:NADP-reducing hydrogenase subunit HndD
MKVTIDNKIVDVAPNTIIYDAAKQIGIDIPRLCYMNLEAVGFKNNPAGCRICVVEVAGRRNLAPSCVTICTEGMNIKTHSPRVLNARKTVLELLLSDHPKDCLICPKSGRCELQDLSIRLGIREIHSVEDAEMSTYRKDASPSIIRDMDKCVMCRRCETA